MRRAIMLLIIACFFSCCGDEQELPDLVLGSWECQDREMTPVFMLSSDGGMAVGEVGWTLTFYMTGRFVSATGVVMTINNSLPLNVSIVTDGTYEAFEHSVDFRPVDTRAYCSDPSFQPYLDIALFDAKSAMQNVITGTSSASVTGDTLYLDGKRWTKI